MGALAWRERQEGDAGWYEYVGELQELQSGQMTIRGKFSWLGRTRGSFAFLFQRCSVDTRRDAELATEALGRLASVDAIPTSDSSARDEPVPLAYRPPLSLRGLRDS